MTSGKAYIPTTYFRFERHMKATAESAGEVSCKSDLTVWNFLTKRDKARVNTFFPASNRLVVLRQGHALGFSQRLYGSGRASVVPAPPPKVNHQDRLHTHRRSRNRARKGESVILYR